MALPGAGPAVLADVKAYVSIMKPGDVVDDARLTRIVAAVNNMVRELPIADSVDAEPAVADWPARIVEGATMLAGRIWRRKDSPAGVAAMGDFGPLYVQRNDPDVALLLKLGDHSEPAVG